MLPLLNPGTVRVVKNEEDKFISSFVGAGGSQVGSLFLGAKTKAAIDTMATERGRMVGRCMEPTVFIN